LLSNFEAIFKKHFEDIIYVLVIIVILLVNCKHMLKKIE